MTNKIAAKMKNQKFLLILFILTSLLSSCGSDSNEELNNEIDIKKIITNYDLWYINHENTEGNAESPFLEKAYTLAFVPMRLQAIMNAFYLKTNIDANIHALGAIVGDWEISNNYLMMTYSSPVHPRGSEKFEVVQISSNKIKINSINKDVSYYLTGYKKTDFDYDKLFYDNIEHFLQEYKGWDLGYIKSNTGNVINNLSYLAFRTNPNPTFYGSYDEGITWIETGSYKVLDKPETNEIKILELSFNSGSVEKFELKVIRTNHFILSHIDSGDRYDYFSIGNAIN